MMKNARELYRRLQSAPITFSFNLIFIYSGRNSFNITETKQLALKRVRDFIASLEFVIIIFDETVSIKTPQIKNRQLLLNFKDLWIETEI